MALEPLAGLRVVDLFAGCGALGIEALSRGAAHADFVESERGARWRAASATSTTLGLDDARAGVAAACCRAGWRGSTARAGGARTWCWRTRPTAASRRARRCEALGAPGVLAAGARVVVEHHAQGRAARARGRAGARRAQRRYGETVVSTYEAAARAAAARPRRSAHERADAPRCSRAPSTRSRTGTSTSPRRAARLFDRVVVAVAHSPAKGTLFTVEERVRDDPRAACKRMRRVEVVDFSDLVVDCARRVGAQVMIRGLRAVSDFEFEFQMALMNRRLSPRLEVAFLMPSQQYTYLNSTLVKEVARLGGPVRGLVPRGGRAAAARAAAARGARGAAAKPRARRGERAARRRSDERRARAHPAPGARAPAAAAAGRGRRRARRARGRPAGARRARRGDAGRRAATTARATARRGRRRARAASSCATPPTPAEVERTRAALRGGARRPARAPPTRERYARDPLFQAAARVRDGLADCFVAGAVAHHRRRAARRAVADRPRARRARRCRRSS